MSGIDEKIKLNAALTEQALELYCKKGDGAMGTLFEAEAYSLLGGGKRIRPFIVNEVAKALGGSIDVSMPFAAALEMIHTYSLIHDDLPCMDDDDMRRGKPTNHVVYGYSTALLAGDALLTKAFLTAAENPYATSEMRTEAVRLIADAAGECGMIGGQVIDLSGESRKLEFCELLELHRLKTGALIKCAARLGALCAGYFPDSEQSKAAAEYAEGIGLAFQVIDDILDATASAEEIGKSVGGDAEHNKTTFLTYYSVEEAAKYAKELTDKAVEKISEWENSDTLCELAEYLLNRKY
ncbi:MAG: polyprenyl synthetase family protein [Ruminococcaceae bacterium]|nr:polyprenyl synthetase family protein [Oscillospiraceae bacterium]